MRRGVTAGLRLCSWRSGSRITRAGYHTALRRNRLFSFRQPIIRNSIAFRSYCEVPKAAVEKGGKVYSELDYNATVGQAGWELTDASDIYYGEDILEGDFGTMEKPVKVYSFEESRIVGCDGGKEIGHDTLWHNVTKEKPLICLECCQVFELVDHPLKDLTMEELEQAEKDAEAGAAAEPAKES
eukprot:TRINITY_DN3000_c0_g5_i1.p1 TRINITY_DN3000_c0_g5~~TRINITY_DN3000_c0_g5_i1.p1  ORF type:complete len:194 (-),score=36.93 TRINITY_DN3000_c0_g5_i1:40-591(-)